MITTFDIAFRILSTMKKNWCKFGGDKPTIFPIHGKIDLELLNNVLAEYGGFAKNHDWGLIVNPANEFDGKLLHYFNYHE